MLNIDGTRQVGKLYIRGEFGQNFENYIEINMTYDKTGDKLFDKVRSVEQFYIESSVLPAKNHNNFRALPKL